MLAPAPQPATGNVRKLLRLESVAVMLLSVGAYAFIHGHWGLFALLLLTPDLSMLAYLMGPGIGAVCYDAVHTYLGPLVLLAVSTAVPSLQPYALIWMAHIGLDRSLGFGLKYATAFGDTHLGVMGQK